MSSNDCDKQSRGFIFFCGDSLRGDNWAAIPLTVYLCIENKKYIFRVQFYWVNNLVIYFSSKFSFFCVSLPSPPKTLSVILSFITGIINNFVWSRHCIYLWFCSASKMWWANFRTTLKSWNVLFLNLSFQKCSWIIEFILLQHCIQRKSIAF